MGFIGTYADLTGYKIGLFRVHALAGRDATGAPRWKLICKECGQEQVLAHTKVATVIEAKAPDNLACVNPSCPLSKSQAKPSESLADFRKRGRIEVEQAARQAESEATHRQKQAAKEQADAAKLAALKCEYRTFWLHQIKTQIEESKITSFKRWRQLQPDTRQMILDKIKEDPTIMVEGL